MVHIVQVLKVLPTGINRALDGQGKSALSFVPSGVRGWVNGYILVPWLARSATRETIAFGYDQAHEVFLKLLETLPEDAWSNGTFYPRQYRTIEQLAHRPTEHFDEHAAHLRRMLGFVLQG